MKKANFKNVVRLRLLLPFSINQVGGVGNPQFAFLGVQSVLGILCASGGISLSKMWSGYLNGGVMRPINLW